MRAKLASLRGALERDEAEVVRIRAERFVAFEEHEDLVPMNAFETPDETLVFVAGQQFEATPRFPDSDFSLVEVLGRGDEVVDFHLVPHGTRLEPLRTVPLEAPADLAWPAHLQTLPGRLEQIEQLPREGAGAREPG